ncbi:2-keto-4-pentenoate hydratase [Alicyclobacillus dauci]|uniref:Fumarylacetoacetate hydrolase family protein n=1 Tax=Alicyclobacillus dauci TaxID=1475485 RepID=A0ABY6Z307_9BACL|nr:fumarylacetoacetate hydrolase family protein [Alicyclobacillus dauci]WAH37135.1 fumarylacetoacetate hydrolase family protein [Alicyclobacillus dauci]
MSLEAIAEEIYRHQTTAEELEKITLRYDGLSVEDAYAIQQLVIQKYTLNGDKLIGWKMGLTSKAKQKSVGVDEAIYGHLLKSMELLTPEISLEGLIHPRIEPEIAFVFKHRLQGDQITPRDVWLATECVMPAVEVIDSRYKNFSFTLVDVVADNTSSAKFYVGDQAFSPYHCQWSDVGVVMKKNGEVVQTGAGAAVLGHPVRSVIEQVHMLHRIGKCIEPGMLVLTGGITEAVYIHDGDRVSVEFEGLGEMSLSVRDQ